MKIHGTNPKFHIIVLLLALLWCSLSFGQVEFRITIIDTNALPVINGGDTINGLNFTIADPLVSQIFSGYTLYSFRKEYGPIPSAPPSITKCYRFKVNSPDIIDSLNHYEDSEIYSYAEEVPIYLPTYTPNDYGTTGGVIQDQRELDLVKAKQAWDISKGSPDIIIGICDFGFFKNHEDLESKITVDLFPGIGTNPAHGTAVAGIAGGATDNGIGMSALGFNSSIGLAPPGVSAMVNMWLGGAKIINGSFGSLTNSFYDSIAIKCMIDQGAIIVCGAGNGPNWENLFPPTSPCDHPAGFGSGRCLVYPASYDKVISVSTVGHKWPIGYTGPYDPGEDVPQNWMDCFDLKPSLPEELVHHYNDSVDICAPGFGVLAPIQTAGVDGYVSSWGTSFGSPMVAGTIALLLDMNPCLNAVEVMQIFKASSANLDLISYNAPYVGGMGVGRLDAWAALQESDGKHITLTSGMNQTWTDVKTIKSLTLKPGSELTIKGKVYFDQDARVYVERGAKLILDGAELRGKCGKTWDFIEVWGNNAASAPTLASFLIGPYPENDTDQGVLVIKNGTRIQDAEIGVYSGNRSIISGFPVPSRGGGVVFAVNSEFINNQSSIIFTPYAFDHISQVSNCYFGEEEGDGGFLPINHLFMEGVSGVKIAGTIFKSENTVGGIPGGIYSTNAAFRVTNCELDGLGYGIYALNTMVVSDAIEIYESEFNLCNRAVLLSGVINSEITENIFNVPDLEGPFQTYGLFLQSSSGYHVEANSFTIPSGGNTVEPYATGIFVENANSLPTEIYKNGFSTLEAGIRTQNNNSNLNIKCNDFNYIFKADIAVTSGALGDQGSCSVAPDPINVTLPAGNVFSSGCFNSKGDYYVHGSVPVFVYNHHTGLEPVCYASSKMILNDCLYSSSSGNPCPSSFGGGVMDRMASADFRLYQIEVVLDSLYQLIINGSDPDFGIALDGVAVSEHILRRLIEASPYLDDEILIATSHSVGLTWEQKLHILIENSPLTDDVLSHIRSFTSSGEALISTYGLENPSVLSKRRRLLSEIHSIERKRDNIVYTKVKALVKEGELDSAIIHLQTHVCEGGSIALIGLLKEEKRWEEALLILDSLDQLGEFYSNLNEFYRWRVGRPDTISSLFYINPKEKMQLEGMVNRFTLVGVWASNLLRINGLVGLEEFFDPFVDDEFRQTETIKLNRLQVFPNPSDGIVFVTTPYKVGDERASIKVFNGLGDKVLEKRITENGVIPIDMKTLPKGVYIFLYEDAGQRLTTKVFLQ